MANNIIEKTTSAAEPETKRRKLVGFDNFKRNNSMSDSFISKKFHHIEFWCGDANNMYRRFQWGLGMSLIAKSDQSTGNHKYCSYVLKSGELIFVFTAPYSMNDTVKSIEPIPGYDKDVGFDFFKRHGLAVRAVGVTVDDTDAAYNAIKANGGKCTLAPTVISDDWGSQTIAEWNVYGDVQMRFVSGSDYTGSFLAGYTPVDAPELSYGLKRLDHAVGNVPKLLEVVEYITKVTGFHEFAEFTSEDVGTVDSGLNSMVLANNNEMILLPINEPTHGTRRKSQIQTYLEHNEGPGLQHMALKCDNIFLTLGEMKKRSHIGGFDFMPHLGEEYYKNLPDRIGDSLTSEEYELCNKLGILVDKDDQGVLLQIFTKPLGDRPTCFIEIIERRGCETLDKDGKDLDMIGGCGGFGKGNFSALFKSIEEYEKTLDAKE